MRAFIQFGEDGLPATTSIHSAMKGFRRLGFETVAFHKSEELMQSYRGDVIVGGVAALQSKLDHYGIKLPSIDYPQELTPWLGRRIWRSTLNEVASDPQQWPIFIKPVKEMAFSGTVIRTPADIARCKGDGDRDVYCSELIDITAEWRVFVRCGQILDVRRYHGDWHSHFDAKIIDAAVAAYKSAPAGYAIDFGVTSKGETVLIEVNDGYALNSYGLDSRLFARMLSARWAEITETNDACRLIGG